MNDTNSNTQTTETYDFVVVGSGGGAMSSALYLRTMGKSVLVLEKTDLVGGSTAKSGGVMWIPNNPYMKADGIEDSEQAAAAYLEAVIGDRNDAPGASAVRRLAYVREAPKMLDFLVSQGIRLRRIPSWPDYYDKKPGASIPGRCVVAELFNINELGEWKTKLQPGFLPLPANLDEAMQLPWMSKSWDSRKALGRILLRAVTGMVTGKRLVTAGNALQGRLLRAVLNAGAEIRLNSPVKHLVVDGDRITGVIAEQDGQERQINARLGVLINAGGFSRNQKMLDKYIPGTKAEWSNTCPGDTGEMIEEAMRLGADTAQMDARIGMAITLPPNHKGPLHASVQNDTPMPHTIVVDQTGVRFVNEAVAYVDFCQAMIDRNKTVPAIPSWMIMDSQFISKYMLAGTTAGKKKPPEWIESGFLKTGETIEELASACELDPATLKATVDRFNGFVEAGKDEDFNRGETVYEQWQGDPYHEPSKSLGKLEQGPFYALQVFPGDVGTYGGLVTDEFARVLRTDGSPIAGLYATGTSTASVMGPLEPAAGGSVGPSFTWGYVAAKHAVGTAEGKA